MTAVKPKVSDQEITGLNAVGLSLGFIAKRLDIHHTTVTYRLNKLNIPVADTRRSFMEDIFVQLSPQQQDWLIQQLGPTTSVKDFVRSLIVKEFISRNN